MSEWSNGTEFKLSPIKVSSRDDQTAKSTAVHQLEQDAGTPGFLYS